MNDVRVEAPSKKNYIDVIWGGVGVVPDPHIIYHVRSLWFVVIRQPVFVQGIVRTY